jgi:hypothetical protein
MEHSDAQTSPSISVTLALNPPILKENEAVELSATVISHAPHPITILTYSSILNLDLAQTLQRSSGNIHCFDLDTDTPVRLQHRVSGRRNPISHKLDDSDSQYYHTLQPGVPYKFSYPCVVSCQELVPGHSYCLSVDAGETVEWWRYGTKEDVLESPGQVLPQHMLSPSGGPITLANTAPIKFTVPSDWKNTGASVAADILAMVTARSCGASKPPSISATISLDTPVLSNDLTAKLSITALSHALVPITIWTWPTILCMNQTQCSESGTEAYLLTHLATGTSIPTEEMFRSRNEQIVHRVDRYFHTLYPEQPYTFSECLTPSFTKDLQLRPGRYRLAVSDSIKLSWWKEGTREEIVTPFGQQPADDMYVSSGGPIVVANIEPIEFTIPVGH